MRPYFGDTFKEILTAAMNLKCNLIVIGTHRRSGLERFWIGSIAEEGVRKLECPVLTIRAQNPETEVLIDEPTG